MRLSAIGYFAITWAISLTPAFAADTATPDFARDVAPIFNKYCTGCHNGTDPQGELSLESFADLQKGGKKGAVVVAGQSDVSLVIRALAGEIEPAMPPPDNPRPSENDIATLRKWIDAGAIGPTGSAASFAEINTVSIPTAAAVHPYLTSLALSPDGKRLALGSYRRVDIVDPDTKATIASTGELPGKVLSVAFSRAGATFVAGSGVAGLYGSATICRTADGATLVQIKGHRDVIYDAQFSPDGRLVATCSYDRMIHLWNAADGTPVRTLSGHNGAVYSLAFSPNGKVLASASADDTIKLWNVKTGERLDTLGQAEGEQSAVAFSPDSKSILAAGADRQLRAWTFLSRDKAEINPLALSRTAHSKPIVKLAMSPDGSRLLTASQGRELVLWDAATLTPIKRFGDQADVVTGLTFASSGTICFVGCINGDWHAIDLSAAEHDAAPKAIEIEENATANNADDAGVVSNLSEKEPNNSPQQANEIGTNSIVSGTISAGDAAGAQDVDLFRFHAHKGQQLILEIDAARSKSPLDSKLEVLTGDGKPIPRVILQAVRSSYFTFRGIDSLDVNDIRMHGAADMELNEYVYANGDVMKLWLLPHGPDSGFVVYPGAGANRYSYFGSTAVTHSLNEPCYVVQPHDPAETLIPNGLPTYTMYCENDDDGWRGMGTDSRVPFTAPADADYIARVSDVRGMGGEKYSYKLIVRPARPGFEIKIAEKDLTINAGSGKEFTVTAIRKDEFDGAIDLALSKLPRGFHVSGPLTIEAGQTTAYGVISADLNAPDPAHDDAKVVTITASARVSGEEVFQKPVELGELKLGARPKFVVKLESQSSMPTHASDAKTSDHFGDVVIAPGETVTAKIKVERLGYDGEIKFGVERAGRNLPHGVYVDNIGLNGITLLKGESERTIFITARKWVPEQTRPFHLRAEEEGKQASWPVTVCVRNSADISGKATDTVAAAPSSN